MPAAGPLTVKVHLQLPVQNRHSLLPRQPAEEGQGDPLCPARVPSQAARGFLKTRLKLWALHGVAVEGPGELS
jgi:hypothetical protein